MLEHRYSSPHTKFGRRRFYQRKRAVLIQPDQLPVRPEQLRLGESALLPGNLAGAELDTGHQCRPVVATREINIIALPDHRAEMGFQSPVVPEFFDRRLSSRLVQ